MKFIIKDLGPRSNNVFIIGKEITEFKYLTTSQDEGFCRGYIKIKYWPFFIFCLSFLIEEIPSEK